MLQKSLCSQKIIFVLPVIFFCNCSQGGHKPVTKPADTVAKATDTAGNNKGPRETVLHKLRKLYATGDFDGDGRPDTIYEHYYSKLRHAEMDSAADPYQNEWDTVVYWFYKQEADAYLAFNKGGRDTLHLGTAQGLYCLINIGDNNRDGKDELAFAVDFLDESRVNSCKIYSLCNRKWTELKEFGIHEDAFNFEGDTVPVFTEIKEFLEKRNRHWVYNDYSKNELDGPDDTVRMKKLTVGKCEQ